MLDKILLKQIYYKNTKNRNYQKTLLNSQSLKESYPEEKCLSPLVEGEKT